MKKKSLLLAFSVGLLAAISAHAQGGIVDGPCNDSPENSTIVLALIGSGGALVASARNRMRARNNSLTKKLAGKAR